MALVALGHITFKCFVEAPTKSQMVEHDSLDMNSYLPGPATCQATCDFEVSKSPSFRRPVEFGAGINKFRSEDPFRAFAQELVCEAQNSM